jgi:hypothetical protein
MPVSAPVIAESEEVKLLEIIKAGAAESVHPERVQGGQGDAKKETTTTVILILD